MARTGAISSIGAVEKMRVTDARVHLPRTTATSATGSQVGIRSAGVTAGCRLSRKRGLRGPMPAGFGTAISTNLGTVPAGVRVRMSLSTARWLAPYRRATTWITRATIKIQRALVVWSVRTGDASARII